MTTWIFQGNPDRFDIDTYLTSGRLIYWSVTRKAYEDQVAEGAPVYIWRARGSSKSVAGIVARGEITERPKTRGNVLHPESLGQQLWASEQDKPSQVKAGIALAEVRLSLGEGMLPAHIIAADAILGTLAIVRSRQGSNFKVGEPQGTRLGELWGISAAQDHDIEISLISAAEGRIKLEVHRSRERSSALRRSAINKFRAENGSLYCQLCSFSFSATYGELGRDFIEVHHIKPMSTIEPGEETDLADLLLVCANCHRMLHQGDPEKNLLMLRAIFSSRQPST